jgi:hypothetical protein
MAEAGITDELLAQQLREGLDAREIQFFAKDGVVVSHRTVVDFATRYKYVDLCLRSKGWL